MASESVPWVNPQHPPSVQGFERFAAEAAERFQGRHLRVRSSTVVHAVGWYRWIGELSLPGPACGTGWAGAAVVGELHAVDIAQPVSCRKCQTTPEYDDVLRFVPHPSEQLAFDFPDEPEGEQPALFTLDEHH